MLKKIKRLIKKYFFNKGFKTNEQLIVIESDDWGSLRSNKEGLKAFKEKFPDFKLDSYMKYDCLEDKEDLQKLFEVLRKHKGSDNKNPVFTANYIMSNINVDKSTPEKLDFIKASDSYQDKGDVINFVKNNLDIFYPQLHGLYHFNLEQLKDDLQDNCIVKFAFQQNMIGFGNGHYQGLDTFRNYESLENIQQAQEIFENCFGYKSRSFIFPCYVWNKVNENHLYQNNIDIIQGGLVQFYSKNNTYIKKYMYMGKFNKNKQVYLTRNCDFEPVKYLEKGQTLSDCKEDCLKQIDLCFKSKKPAIICSHRANYVGGIDKKVRNNNLKTLDELLKQIINKYPKVRFISSEELGDLIIKEKYENS